MRISLLLVSCVFVHIHLDGTQKIYYIPPAISDRILFNDIICDYTYYIENSSGDSSLTPNTSFAIVRGGRIFCKDAGKGYLNFCFPIDSNK